MTLKKPLRVAVIGYGYWGPNLARNIVAHHGSELVAIGDISAERLEYARIAHPSVQTTTDIRSLLEREDIDAVAIATPPETHRDVAVEALECGKHVLVEKPLATSVVDARAIAEAAQRRCRTLMIDHTFLFTGAVRRLKEYLAAGSLGDIYYFDSTRINLGLFSANANVIWDLAPHDISIMLHLLDEPVRTVSAIGASHMPGQAENIAYLTLQFDSPLLAHFHVNWLSPVKIRKTIIGGSKRMAVYDDMEQSEKLKVYDSGADLIHTQEEIYRSLVEYRTGDVVAPRLEKAEALAVEWEHFLNVVAGTERSISGPELGVEVVTIIEAAERSLRSGGMPVALDRRHYFAVGNCSVSDLDFHGARAFITGGAGFIGSHIADQLLVRGAGKIVVLDDFARGRIENLGDAFQTGRVEVVTGDVRDASLVDALTAGSDFVFHQAALRITQSAEEPVRAIQVMVGGTQNVLESAVKHRVSKVLSASSASVYGEPSYLPMDEAHPFNNRTLYGAAKIADEQMHRAYAEMYGLSYIMLRPFNVYGPRMDVTGVYTEVMIRWLERLLSGQRPAIFGDGTQTMDFISVEDVAREYLLAAASSKTDLVLNAGTGVESSLKELCTLMCETTGSVAEPEFLPARTVNPVTRRCAGTDLARQEIGFESQVELRDGLLGLLEWYRKEPAASGTRV